MNTIGILDIERSCFATLEVFLMSCSLIPILVQLHRFSALVVSIPGSRPQNKAKRYRLEIVSPIIPEYRSSGLPLSGPFLLSVNTSVLPLSQPAFASYWNQGPLPSDNNPRTMAASGNVMCNNITCCKLSDSERGKATRINIKIVMCQFSHDPEVPVYHH